MDFGPEDAGAIIERFTRISPDKILYKFTVEDPTTWDRPWTGEYTWPQTDQLLYEYACHEGNYALTNILQGERAKEKREAAQRPQP